MRLLLLIALFGTGPAEELVQIGGQEEAESLLERVLERRSAVRAIEGGLTFSQLITTERLDDEAEIVSTVNQLYLYEPVAGRHLWKLIEHDGEPISGRRFHREERRGTPRGGGGSAGSRDQRPRP